MSVDFERKRTDYEETAADGLMLLARRIKYRMSTGSMRLPLLQFSFLHLFLCLILSWLGIRYIG